MVCTGVGAPFGAGLITYGSGVSTTGTVMDLTNDVNEGKWSNQKFTTKAVLEAASEAGGAVFEAMGVPEAGAVVKATTVGVDYIADKMREASAGPYRKN